MKVTIELDDDIIWVLARRTAEACADSWYDACSSDGVLTLKDKKALYKHAFYDGMHYLLTLIEQSNNDTKAT